MGRDAVDPFSEDPDKLSFVLCRTSNRSAADVQDHGDEERLFMKMAKLVKAWNINGNLGLVVGATFPEELDLVRKEVGYDIPILVPGVGAQGGDLGKVLQLGTDGSGGNILINVSRDIMFAFTKEAHGERDIKASASKAAKSYVEMIREELERCGKW
jgi:orotidine-5'-phosphate decarboxylase